MSFRVFPWLKLFLGAETHYVLDAGAVVPATIEQDDLTCRRKLRDIALRISDRSFSGTMSTLIPTKCKHARSPT